MARSIDLQVRRDALAQTRLVRTALPALNAGEALIAIERFALTANNVTYAAFGGPPMNYFDFFPAPDGWGRPPVWGFGHIVESRAEGIAAGLRVYGYFPFGSHLIVQPAKAGPRGFSDASAHRAHLHAVYNAYQTVGAPDPAADAQAALFRPLFTTSFVLDDLFADAPFSGARGAILASASSKTALGLAHLLKQRGGITVTGLTSPGNAAFCTRTGTYDRVLAYRDAASLDVEPAVFIDMAGDSAVRAAAHHRLGDQLMASIMVGATHVDAPRSMESLPGPQPQLFFAPDRIARRNRDWGAEGFQSRLAAAWAGFIAAAADWIAVEDLHGPAAGEAAWRDAVAGRIAPDRGLMIAMTE